jgi:hypothetical protein
VQKKHDPCLLWLNFMISLNSTEWRTQKPVRLCYPLPMTSAIQAELPPELLARARAFVEEGWATDVNELLAEALRRYLESHSSQLSETFIREDVEWGLNGDE